VLIYANVAGTGVPLSVNCVTVSLNAVIGKHPNVLVVFLIDKLAALSSTALLGCYV